MCPNLPSYTSDSVMQVVHGSSTSVYITYNAVFNTVGQIKYMNIYIFQSTIKPLFCGIWPYSHILASSSRQKRINMK